MRDSAVGFSFSNTLQLVRLSPGTHHPSAVDMGLSQDKTGHEGDLYRQ